MPVNKEKVYALLLLCRTMALAFLLFPVTLSMAAVEWTPLPITTPAQRAAGIAGGEGTQMIFGMSYAPSNPSIVYFVTDTSQVWKSVDGGTTWKPKHNGLPTKGGLSLAIDPTNENIVFVAGSAQVAGTPHSSDVVDGIYRTTDGGEKWDRLRLTNYFRPWNTRGGTHFAFKDSNIIYAGTHEEGILKSVDGGDNWTVMNLLTTTKVLDLKFAMDTPTTKIYVAAESGLYLLEDDQAGTVNLTTLWLTANAHPADDANDPDDFARSIAVDAASPGTFYGAFGSAGIYKSTDWGASFQRKNSGINPFNWGKEAVFLVMSPTDPQTLYTSLFNLSGPNNLQPYYTHDGGDNWHNPTDLDKGGLMAEFAQRSAEAAFQGAVLAVHPTDPNTVISSAAMHTPMKSIDGGDTWKFSGSGYSGTAGFGNSSFGWDMEDPDHFFFFVTDFGQLETKDGGKTFVNLSVKNSGNLRSSGGALDPAPGSKRIAIVTGGWNTKEVAVSQDGGATWTRFDGTQAQPDTKGDHRYVAFHPQNSDVIYAGKYRSTDGGISWTPLDHEVRAVFPGNGDIVYAGKVPGGTWTLTVYKSTDRGSTWTTPFDDIFMGNTKFGEMTVDPRQEDRLYVTANTPGVMIWDGTKWLKKGVAEGLTKDQLGNINASAITIDRYHPNVLYVGKAFEYEGASNGVFMSEDYGSSWTNITGSLGPDINIRAVSVNPHNGYLYIQTYHGTYYRPPPYPDSDGDGRSDATDNCPNHANNNQKNSDGDSLGDACDAPLFSVTDSIAPADDGLLEFATLTAGDSSSASITLANSGTDPVTLKSATFSSETPFAINKEGGDNPCGSETPQIEENKSCTLGITFAPTGEGTFEVVLTLTPNEANSPPKTFTLKGTALAAPAEDTTGGTPDPAKEVEEAAGKGGGGGGGCFLQAVGSGGF